MENFQVYRDIQARTGGDIYIGVVGPVRTGKSTFIRRFMELVALPSMDPAKQAEVRDQLPLSGSGKLITTVEPKFIPREAVSVDLGEDQKVKIRLIDCVGFLVKDVSGHIEDGRERMVKTPWFDKAIPFHEAAETGTRKVIQEHATIGLVITTDGSFGELPRENFIEAEETTVTQLKKQGKPFLLLVNSQMPYKEETQKLVRELQEKYGITTMAANCEQLRKEDIARILSNILYEFPVSEIQFFVPKWVEMLPADHELKHELLDKIREQMKKMLHIRDITKESVQMESPYAQDILLEDVSLSSGKVRIRVQIKDIYYYKMLSEMSGIRMESEYDLIHTMKELAAMKEQYVKVQSALEAVRETGYGVVVPELNEIQIEEPSVIRQGSKYGVKIKSKSPSIHMIRANIETEIAPIVGTEQQANDLIQYIGESSQRGESIWETNIFGKSIEQLVQDGIRSKLTTIGEESQSKLQDTMQKIVNDSKGGMVCIII
ncbi:stage IV sporulation protein A [Blautia sp. MSJ-19]|uniref:stage IV sporulation protein A n=1 Tax=Blautia sp. MSJ-19 TaxID=2841517 RepID=UPI001C0F2750|nr:stage IV sporulation protein A [Blautia sp. MSJ-19]MBU5480109.1 stage IV sporulation protein A [Blautia sp. MSJ-19]